MRPHCRGDDQLFAGIRFVLVGFDSVSESQYRSEMVRRGGADAGRYDADCSHVVVCGRVYDDPVCVASRKDGKRVVTELWVDDSLDLGELADADRVIYRPVRDLNGIPGSESLHICLTGYQRTGREDIMKMVSLMGAQFSKPLIANQVTHLICYKFEGEKYELAKRVNIKLVNHRWLEDCLKAGEILSTDDYTNSGWELEMMEAQAKDSEDDTEDAGKRSFESRASARSTPITENGMRNNIDREGHAPTRSPIVPNGNAESAAGRHVSTPEQIRKAEDVSKKALSNGAAARTTPNTSGMSFSADLDAHGPVQTPISPSGSGQSATVRHLNAPDQIKRDRAKDADKGAPDIRASTLCAPDTGGITASADRHVHATNGAPTVPRDNIETVAGRCSNNPNEINVTNVLVTTPSKDSSEKVLHSSNMSRKVDQEDDGLAADPNVTASQSNIEDKLILCNANLKSAVNEAPEKIHNLSYSKRHSVKSVSSEEPSVHQTASPESAEGNISKIEFNIAPLGKSDRNNGESVDAQSPKDDEMIEHMDRPSGEVARKRKGLLSSVSRRSPNGDLASEAGTANSSSANMESAYEAATASDLGRNSMESAKVDSFVKGDATVNLMEKQLSGSSKSKLLSYRRTSLKRVRSLQRTKLPGISADDKNIGALEKARTEAVTEKRRATSPSTDAEDGTRSSGFSLQNKDAEDAQLNVGNVASCLGSSLMYGRTGKDLMKDKRPGTGLCGSENSELGHSNGSPDIEIIDAQQVDKNVVVVPNSEPDKVISHENVEVGPEVFPVSVNAVEFEIASPKKVSISRVRNAGAKRPWNARNGIADGSMVSKSLAAASNSDLDKILSHGSVKAEPENAHTSASAAECETFSPQKIPSISVRNAVTKRSQNANIEMIDAPVVSKSEFANVLSEENVKTDPKNVLSSASADESQRSSPKNVSSTTAKNAIEKRSLNSGIEMTDATAVEKTETTALKSKFDEVVPPENADSYPKKLSSSASADDCEACSPVPTNRVRNAVAKRKMKVVQQHKFGSATLSVANAVSSKRTEESCRNVGKVTADQEPHKAKQDRMNDAAVSFCKDVAIEDKSEGLQNSKLKSSKRHRTAYLMDISSDNEKENIPAYSDISSKSKCENSFDSSKCSTKAVQNGKDGLGEHSIRKGNECRTLSVLELTWFILSGHRLQRKDYRSILRRLKGRVCRDSHHWSFQATHFITPELRRTEKLFAAAAAGRWILKTDYLTSCNEAGKFLEEEPFEWHGNGLNSGDTISLDAPRKWRLLRQHTGHGAFYGMQIIIYGECISPSLDTLKRAVRAGDGTILATSPPYTRFLKSSVDFAVVSPSTPSADAWVQEFGRHNIPCISADYLVEYICKPGYPLNKHVLYKMHDLAEKSLQKLLKNQYEVLSDTGEPLSEGGSAEVSCSGCGSNDREEVMLICGDEGSLAGCGAGMHIDCIDPPLGAVPDGEWLCPQCNIGKAPKKTTKGAKSRASKRR